MNDDKFKKKVSADHEVEEKIFRAGAELFSSCLAYDIVSDASIGEFLGATEEFHTFIRALIKAGDGKNFIARDRALRRLTYKK